VTPVTSNSALETCASAARVLRTKVGSPYVIEGMKAATADGATLVVGFEANGGVLLGSTLQGEKLLPALPTRDAMLPILCVLTEAFKRGASLSEIAAGFGFRATASGRLENVAPDRSRQFLSRLAENRAYADTLFSELGGIAAVDMLDGIRLFAATGEIVHFRASGNAPELRCYVEADREGRANDLLFWGLELARRQTEGPGESS
jgi:phosphomannomutase